jgi:hypothetical protein
LYRACRFSIQSFEKDITQPMMIVVENSSFHSFLILINITFTKNYKPVVFLLNT